MSVSSPAPPNTVSPCWGAKPEKGAKISKLWPRAGVRFPAVEAHSVVWPGRMSWGVNGGRDLLRLPGLVPRGEDKYGLPHLCAVEETTGWEWATNFCDLVGITPGWHLAVRRILRWGKGLIRLFKSRKLILVLYSPFTPVSGASHVGFRLQQ